MKKKKDLQRFVCLDDHDGRRGSSNKDVEICNKMHCFHFFSGKCLHLLNVPQNNIPSDTF